MEAKFKVGDTVRFVGSAGPEAKMALAGDLVVKKVCMPPRYANDVPLYDFGKAFAALENELELVQPQKAMIYQVANSSWYDTNSYDCSRIQAAVQRAGGTNIHLSRQNGWSNLPEVVCFEAENVEAVAKEVWEEMGSEYAALIFEKDWN